jgi:hypothetical protein
VALDSAARGFRVALMVRKETEDDVLVRRTRLTTMDAREGSQDLVW